MRAHYRPSDGVWFIDADGDGKISNLAEYVFTEWDRTASDDMEAMRRVFDTDGDGKLTEADARWGEFRVMVTNADGTTTAKTLAELGITEINLRPNVTRITLPDGSRRGRDMISGVEQMEIRRAA